jgi:hypothetical protein
MENKMRFVLFILLSFLLSACAPWQKPYIASNHEYTNSPKIAKAKIHSFFKLVSLGDADLNKIKKENNIKKIHHIDIAEDSFLFFYRNVTFTIYGE